MSGQFSISTKLACLKRELALRKNVYALWVNSGKMKMAIAEREIAVLEAICDDYQQALNLEQLHVARHDAN
jgi:hypothetical protein